MILMKISVISPYYNEAEILEQSIERMIKNLENLKHNWEFILVNDGSTDGSFEIAQKLAKKYDRLKNIGYTQNQGSGYAIQKGFNEAAGEIIVTTEVDCSWGDDIVKKMINKLLESGNSDYVIASPNLPSGGYKNVPLKRVMISKIGNKILNLFFSNRLTMFTGMTRAYKKEVLEGLSVQEKGKGFHLEILNKLFAFGYNPGEVPAMIEWQDFESKNGKPKKRKSSLKISKTINSHLLFAVLSKPIRYLWAISVFCFLIGLFFVGGALYRLIIGKISVYWAIIGLVMWLFTLIFFGFGVVTAQNRLITEELWNLNKKLFTKNEEK